MRALDSRSLLVTWRPPPADQQNGAITYYKLFYKLSGHNDSQTVQITVNDPTRRNFTLDELHKFAEYSVRVLAGTRVGDGPASRPVLARTDEDGTYAPAEPLTPRHRARQSRAGRANGLLEMVVGWYWCC